MIESIKKDILTSSFLGESTNELKLDLEPCLFILDGSSHPANSLLLLKGLAAAALAILSFSIHCVKGIPKTNPPLDPSRNIVNIIDRYFTTCYTKYKKII